MPSGSAGPGKRSFAVGLGAKGSANQLRKDAATAVKESSLLVSVVQIEIEQPLSLSFSKPSMSLSLSPTNSTDALGIIYHSLWDFMYGPCMENMKG